MDPLGCEPRAFRSEADVMPLHHEPLAYANFKAHIVFCLNLPRVTQMPACLTCLWHAAPQNPKCCLPHGACAASWPPAEANEPPLVAFCLAAIWQLPGMFLVAIWQLPPCSDQPWCSAAIGPGLSCGLPWAWPRLILPGTGGNGAGGE